MKILVTGAMGFIGAHTVKNLVACGHELHGIDNLNSYYSRRLKNNRWDTLVGPDVELDVVDIWSANALDAVFKRFKPEIVIHLAAQAGVRYSLENPRAYVDANIMGTFNVLDSCQRHDVRKIVFASSSSIYENESLYAATKISTEAMVESYAKLYGIKATGLRFFTVYGPWGRPDMAPWKFTQKILNKQPIEVFNYGHMSRDFTFIDDVVHVINHVTHTEQEEAYAVHDVGRTRPRTIAELIAITGSLCGHEPHTLMMPMQRGDVLETRAEPFSGLNNDAFVDLEAGMSYFVDWYKREYGDDISQ